MKFRSFLSETEGQTKIKQHETLNPKLWDGEVLKPEVAKALLRIAGKFIETLKLPMDAIRDIVFTGSNCAYTYTKLSDADVHVEIDPGMLADCEDCRVDSEACFQAMKTLWNEQHDISVMGVPVELYATAQMQNVIQNAGAYSLAKSQWIQKPNREQGEWSQEQVESKVRPLRGEIEQLISSNANDQSALLELHAKIMRMRQSGLQSGGELSLENLAFKKLRDEGLIKKLREQIQRAEDDELSIHEGLTPNDPKFRAWLSDTHERAAEVKARDEKIKKVFGDAQAAINDSDKQMDKISDELTAIVLKDGPLDSLKFLQSARKRDYRPETPLINVLDWTLDDDEVEEHQEAVAWYREHYEDVDDLLVAYQHRLQEAEKKFDKLKLVLDWRRYSNYPYFKADIFFMKSNFAKHKKKLV